MKSQNTIKTSKRSKQCRLTRRRKKTKQSEVQLQEQIVQKSLAIKFASLMSKKHHQFLKEKFCEFYGKNYSITYKQQYEFGEQWQGFSPNEQLTDKYWVSENQNIIYSSLIFVVMLFNAIMIWFNTIETFFIGQNHYFTNSVLFIMAIALQIFYYIFKRSIRKRNPQYRETFINLFKKSYRHITILIYFLLKLANFDKFINIYWWFVIEAVGIYLMYRRAANIYSSFKHINLALIYEYQFKVIDIILNLVIIAHFVAIILYQSTKLDFEKTWISEAGIEDQSPLVKYIYSFYFCCTTILTVGYGDISPKNYAEVIIITFVQILGIIAFGSLINEVGYSLSVMRKKREDIEKDLHVIEKIKKWHKLDDQLARRARSHIITNKSIDSQLSPEQQNKVMVKLSQDLREEIKSQNTFKMVKSSVFFLLRWSKCFQTAVSSRLINIIFPPGELLYQPFGKQRIYMIREGKVDIYASKRGSKRGSNASILKTIQNSLSKEVCNNVYGYTAVLSQRPVQLYAVAKRNTSGYYIDKQSFLECIYERQADFEYFHELKDKIDYSRYWQANQVPVLESSKHHYNPTHTYVIKLQKSVKNHQMRSPLPGVIRMKNRTKLKCDNGKSKQFQDLNRRILSINQIQNNSGNYISDVFQDQAEFPMHQIKYLKYFHHGFQSSKEYSNYFPRNNRNNVLRLQQTEHGVPSSIDYDHAHSMFYDALQSYRQTLN